MRLAVAIVFLTASVYIPRAPTDGDSLAYHLPNAIAWAQAGSLDPTWMRYWWYPGGSEISIAGIIASGGLWITGVPSLLAAMMLTSRIGMWLRSLDVPAWTAAAMSAALITITTAAFQTYDQRNDLVLAAWFVETLWMLRNDSWSGALPIAMLALIKPYGWVYALLAIVCTRKPRALVGFVPLALWIVHDAVLAPRALISIASTNAIGTWSTTVAGNLPASLTVLAKAIAERGPVAVCCFVAPMFALLARGKERWIAIAGTSALVLFLLTPFGYANDIPQLALGWSLRYDLPSLALGDVVPLAAGSPVSDIDCRSCGVQRARGHRPAAVYLESRRFDSHRVPYRRCCRACCDRRVYRAASPRRRLRSNRDRARPHALRQHHRSRTCCRLLRSIDERYDILPLV